MIYVLIAASGEYDCYSEENCFASTSRDVVELKLQEYEEKENRERAACKELLEYHHAINEEFPAPVLKSTGRKELVWDGYTWIGPDQAALKIARADHSTFFMKLENEKAKELGEKYKVERVTWWYEPVEYSIQEVESD